MAPAFTMGLNGRLRSSTTIELKALPDGSTPTCSSTWSRPLVFERHPEHERLRDRLDGEVEIGVAHLVHVAVGRHHADAEPVRVGPAQLGDVGGHLALVELPVLVEEAVQVVEDRGSGHDAEVEVVEGAIEPAVEACHGGI